MSEPEIHPKKSTAELLKNEFETPAKMQNASTVINIMLILMFLEEWECKFFIIIDCNLLCFEKDKIFKKVLFENPLFLQKFQKFLFFLGKGGSNSPDWDFSFFDFEILGGWTWRVCSSESRNSPFLAWRLFGTKITI